VCTADGEEMTTCIFPIKTNLWIINDHCWRGDEMILEGYFGNPQKHACVTKKAVVHVRETYHIADTDLRVLYIPSFGDQADVSAYFPPETFKMPYSTGRWIGHLLYRQSDGVVHVRSATQVRFELVEVGKLGRTRALRYEVSGGTELGMCGSPLFVSAGATFLAGFHFAGKDDEGAACCLTLQRWEAAEREFLKDRMIRPTLSSGTMELQAYGCEYGPLEEPHGMCATQYLQDQSSVEIFGRHQMPRRTIRSEIGTSMLSSAVALEMDLPKLHGPPVGMRDARKVWHTKWSSMAVQALFVRKECLFMAYDDLRSRIFAFLKTKNEAKDSIHPYSRITAVSGADGVFAVDAMNKSTSAGFPLNAPKGDYLVRLDHEVEGITEPWDVSPAVAFEMERMCDSYRRGERCYPVFRANMKDEATKTTKTKVRVFMGAPLAYNVLFRMYYLSILKFMMENMYIFECAVGINAYGPEWTALTNHVAKYGKDRVFAGDYKAFDDGQSADMTYRTMCILIDIAQWAGYSADQLCIMRGLATDVAFCVFEMDGVLARVCGIIPSGFNATTQINSLDNSIYMRYVYYRIYGSDAPPFHTRVSLLTYGDDNIGSVKEGCDEFNHTTVSQILGEIGVEYTMADKTSESVPYISLCDADFLKRKFVFSSELSQYMAPLTEDSISKSLHCYRTGSGIPKEELALDAMAGACREFFLHGKEVFETRRAELMRVGVRAGLTVHLSNRPLPEYDALKEAYLASVGGSAAAVEL
jgi:hypothetical protein